MWLITFVLSVILGAIGAGLLCCSRIWLQFRTAHARCYKCMVGRTVIVTGANRGMGFWTAMDFARRGARVVLACKRKDQAEQARLKIVGVTRNKDVVGKQLNLAQFRSIRTFAYDILRSEARLDVLVHNAGAVRPNGLTEDGLHPSLQINALGPLQLTLSLLDLLKSTSNSRVVVVTTSEGARFDDVPSTFIDKDDGYLSYIRNYNGSKKCLGLAMLELADRLQDTEVSVLFSIPRPCRTDLQFYDNHPDVWVFIKKYLLFPFMYMTPEDAVENTIFCALSDEVKRKSGTFWRNCTAYKTKGSDPDVVALRSETWSKCLDWLKMKPSEVNVINTLIDNAIDLMTSLL